VSVGIVPIEPRETRVSPFEFTPMSRPTGPICSTASQPRRRGILSRGRNILIGQLIAAGVTAIATGVTAIILYRQTSLMGTQARISAIVQAPNVIVDSDGPTSASYISLTFRNIGHSNAYQLLISPYADWEPAANANFDPFRFWRGKLQTTRIPELAEGRPAQCTYTITTPRSGEVVYLYGKYEYESPFPNLPKDNRQFCYIGRENGRIEPCGTSHVVAIHVPIITKRADVRGAATAGTPAPP
jgi:hypothetical protein